MRVLITGSEGFVGRNLVPYFKENQIEVVTLDMEPSDRPGHIQYRLGSYKEGLPLHGIDCVIHLASQSHVDRSITGPREFIDDNVGGTLELYEAIKTHNLVTSAIKQVVQFSTDEVGACLRTGELIEEYRFHTGSVYSASKGAQELLAQAYLKTFNLPIVITRCVNIFGAHQANEKFIPTVCRKALANEPIPVYGNGMQLRQWVSVEHVCDFLNVVSTSNCIPPGALLHITGTREIYNITLAHTILSLLDKPADLVTYVTDRLGHDTRYSLGRTEETDRFGLPKYHDDHFMTDLKETVKHYKEKYGR